MIKPPAAGRGAVAASLVVAVGAVLSACNFAPHYEPPKLDTGAQFKEAVHGADPDNEGWQISAPRDAALRGKWWEVYGDPKLNELEERVAISNQSIIAAAANYRAAHALMQEAQAALFPTISLNPGVTYLKSSAAVQSFGSTTASTTGAGTTGTGTTGTGTTGTGTGTGVTGTGTGGTGTTTSGTTSAGGSTAARSIFSLPLEASYQVDLWGSIRNNVAQDRFAAEASAATLANLLLSTQSTLAQDYFQVRIADEERRVLDETLHDFEDNLHLVQTLYKNGLDSDEDMAQAETQLKSAQAQATDLGVVRATYEHALAVLIGVPPANFSLPYQRYNQQLPPVPVDGVPADLLERRPDIAAAERQVAAANANIGVARAAFFPTLSLTGEAGYEATKISQLIRWPNRFWSLGADLAQTIFDGGLRRAAAANAWAQDDAAAANYRQTVLSALQMVEDNLASLRILNEEVKQQHDAAAAAQRAVKLSVVRFQNGVDSYVNVITAQNAFLTSREAEIQVQLRQLTASVNLINNLGGGWSSQDLAQTEHMAANASSHEGKVEVKAGIPADDAGAPVANPPALPPREIKPDEMLKRNEDAMAPQPGGVER
jgi:NodT family efflux transporter outer membrane factor (OMF) lipoprotein